MNVVGFVIPGDVRGKGRPRFVRATGRAYTDEPTVSYENLIKITCVETMGEAPVIEGPVWLHVEVRCRPPAATSKKRLALMLRQHILPTTKPDMDNVVKLVMDALNGVAWHDDKQVVVGSFSRRYAEESSLLIQFREIRE